MIKFRKVDNVKDQSVVILCGGKGTRLREETIFKPKPLVEIGNKPILWHIMKIYSYYGFNNFVLCLGYKGQMIKDYFLNYGFNTNDFEFNLSNGKAQMINGENEEWNIKFIDTGPETNTGGRIKKIEKYIENDDFLATYGDGVANINIKSLYKHHKNKGKIGTLSALHPTSKYGILQIDESDTVTYFKEKPQLTDWVSGGFMVFKKDIFDYLEDNSVLETTPFEKLVSSRELSVFQHHGFWGSMDTYKDVEYLNNLWNTSKDWKVWDD